MNERIAFPTDEHFPYQDDRARSVALQIVRDFDPTIRISGSDGMDFYSVSKYDKNPRRLKAGGLQEEIDAWQAGQREWMDASPNAAAKFIIGNHEDRLRRYLWKNPELWGLRSLELPELLDFEHLGIENEVYDEIAFRNLVIKHGTLVRKHSAYTARGELEGEFFSTWLLTGHTHRGGTTYAKTRHGIVRADECFCLCDLEPEYVPNPNWQQGIVLAEIINGRPSVEAIPFYRAGKSVRGIWRGQEYRS